MAKEKFYCLMCGNHLDPKIHIMKYGKHTTEVQRHQLSLLMSLMKSMYVVMPKGITEHWGSVFNDEMTNLQKEIDMINDARKI